MTRFIATPSRTKEILETYGLRAKKGFGQNFLVDPKLVERCAEEAHCQGAVIEIGPGIGSLTEQLAIHSQHVTAFEVDEDLIPVLQDTLSPYDNVEVILEDFLTCNLPGKVKELKEKYGSVVVCANLPYYITTPVLFRIFEEASDISYITVMVQKEVGERFSAEVGSPQYSSLSVEAQYLYNVKRLFNVPARSFNPSPNVDSIIIQFERKENLDSSIDYQDFFAFVKGCFKQRRKTIYNNLKEYLEDGEKAKQMLEEANIDSKKRAQEMGLEELERLYQVKK